MSHTWTETKRTGSFKAVGVNDGVEHTVFIYTKFVCSSGLNGNIDRNAAGRSLRLADGTDVSPGDEEGTYVLLDFAETVLKSDDPNRAK